MGRAAILRRVTVFEAWTAEEVWALIDRFGARTLVFDVEPLVAVWATDTATLDAGVAETLGRVAGLGDNGPEVAAGEAESEAGAEFRGEARSESGVEFRGEAGPEYRGEAGSGPGIEVRGEAGTEVGAEVRCEAGTEARVYRPTAPGAGSAGARPRVEVVVFATNSDRLPTGLPGLPGARVGYRAMAAKPLRVRGFRDLPGPGLVIGDQIATDGALAWRLGFDFVYYQPVRGRIPFRPRLLHLLGGGLRPLLFQAPPFR